MKKKRLVVLIIAALLILAVGGYFGVEALIMSKAPDPVFAANEMMAALCAAPAEKAAESEMGALLQQALINSRGFEGGRVTESRGRNATVTMTISQLDPTQLEKGLQEAAQGYLAAAVEGARLSEEIYNSDRSYREEVLIQAGEAAFAEILPKAELSRREISLVLKYTDGSWQLLNEGEIGALLWSGFEDADALAAELCEKAVENPEYVRKIYTIEENAKAGPVPNQANFGKTTDPGEIEALLERPEAQALINGQELVWNRDIELIPDTYIHYYLDESILCIVWQEEEAKAVGTFSEVFIADGSQLRRKIAGDSYQSGFFYPATTLAQQSNAVLGVGGDLYHHGRNCGIVVIEREAYRYDLTSCDICYIDSEGDMKFSYRGQFTTPEEADAFIAENDAIFSISFGPVLVDNGVDVTPDYYPWGEILDTYARSALGMLGDKHYLTMNINCMLPHNYYLATLRQAADAMIERGCIKAYALDGGQTATTVFNGVLINPVQFGTERALSDIIYFASAVPN